MEYIAHSDKERVQTLKAHLEGTARLAEAFASRFGKGIGGIAAGCFTILENIPMISRRKSGKTAQLWWITPLPGQRSACRKAACTDF